MYYASYVDSNRFHETSPRTLFTLLVHSRLIPLTFLSHALNSERHLAHVAKGLARVIRLCTLALLLATSVAYVIRLGAGRPRNNP